MTDGRRAAHSLVIKSPELLTAVWGHSRPTWPPLCFSLPKSWTSQGKACNGIINMWVLLCSQTAHLKSTFSYMQANINTCKRNLSSDSRRWRFQHKRGSFYSVGLIVWHWFPLDSQRVYKPNTSLDPAAPTSHTHSLPLWLSQLQNCIKPSGSPCSRATWRYRSQALLVVIRSSACAWKSVWAEEQWWGQGAVQLSGLALR